MASSRLCFGSRSAVDDECPDSVDGTKSVESSFPGMGGRISMVLADILKT